MDEFNVILAATKGDMDDNIKVGAYIALSDPQMFAQYGFVLRTMVPQIDRVCITTVKDGKISELMGPSSRMGRREKAKKENADGAASAKTDPAEKAEDARIKEIEARLAQNIWMPWPESTPRAKAWPTTPWEAKWWSTMTFRRPKES